MKRGFIVLLMGLIIAYGWEGYQLLLQQSDAIRVSHGKLSDVAEKVLAIPLQQANGKSIQKPRKIRQVEDRVFLVSEGILYQYNEKGTFINSITDPSSIQVADYVIDPAGKQLIVIGNQDDIHYYSYTGELKEQIKFIPEGSDHRLLSLSYYNDRLWFTQEVTVENGSETPFIEKQLVEYDTAMHKMNTYSLSFHTKDRFNAHPSCTHFLFSVRQDTGEMYMFSPSLHSHHLLRDTFNLKRQKDTYGIHSSTSVPVYPVRMGHRFWMATYENVSEEFPGYFYCYDWKTNRYWQTDQGLQDNYFQTGYIKDLQPMDIYNQTYCFVRHGDSIRQSFPEQYQKENPVLFIVTLKG